MTTRKPVLGVDFGGAEQCVVRGGRAKWGDFRAGK